MASWRVRALDVRSGIEVFRVERLSEELMTALWDREARACKDRSLLCAACDMACGSVVESAPNGKVVRRDKYFEIVDEPAKCGAAPSLALLPARYGCKSSYKDSAILLRGSSWPLPDQQYLHGLLGLQERNCTPALTNIGTSTTVAQAATSAEPPRLGNVLRSDFPFHLDQYHHLIRPPLRYYVFGHYQEVSLSMESLPESQSRLLSLPLELRLQICKQFLKGWRISLMYWGRSFGSVDSTTKSDIFDDEMWKISLFHINRQTRLLATSLIGPCVSMGLEARYLRPTRSNYGKPIPQLFLEKIQTLRFDYFNEIATSEIALESFPALRYLILDCGAWPVEIFGSHVRKDWSAYASDGKDGELLEFGYRSVVSGDWTRGLFQDKTRTWHMICDTGIDFPDIKGECVETMVIRPLLKLFNTNSKQEHALRVRSRYEYDAIKDA